MNPYVKDRSFPDCFPKDFATSILPDDAMPIAHKGYRLCKSGAVTRQDFVSTCEERLVRLFSQRKVQKKPLPRDPSCYSTSCYSDLKELQYVKQFVMKKVPPEAVIAEGVTAPECGLSRQSSRTSHIDWWIYKDTAPETYFTAIGEEVTS